MGFLTGTVQFTVYSDTAETDFPRRLVASIEEAFSKSTAAEAQTVQIALTASGSQAITFNGVDSVKAFYIYSDATDINVNMNSLGNIAFTAAYPGFVPAQVTSMTITNASSSVATNVTLVLIKG